MTRQSAAERALRASRAAHQHSLAVPGTCTCGFTGQGKSAKRSVGLHIAAASRKAVKDDAQHRREARKPSRSLLRAIGGILEAPQPEGVSMTSSASETPASSEPTSTPSTSVSGNSERSGEANPMAEAPANPTDAQQEQAAKQD